jgi:hypothetical protein
MSDIKSLIVNASKLDDKKLEASILTLATTPSTGGVLRQLGMMAVGAGIRHEEDDEWTFRPLWNKFAKAFYVGDRVKPKADGEEGDQYFNALEKLAGLGQNTTWKADDRIRVAEWIADQKKKEGGMLPMTNMGTLAKQLVGEFDKAAPTKAELTKFLKDKATRARSTGTTSEFKRRVAALDMSITSLIEAEDFDKVDDKHPELTTMAADLRKRINDFAVKAAAVFKAEADAAKAKTAKPAKKGKKADASELTSAQRKAASLEKIAAIAARGSNGEAPASTTEH